MTIAILITVTCIRKELEMSNTVRSNSRKWWALFALSLGVFMSLLDVTIVNVALPIMAESFKTNFSNVQWVISAYTISYAVVILVVAKLGDMYGRKRIYLISMVIFVLASAINGLAPSLLILNIGRAIQAFGGAGLMSLALALVASLFDGKERGMALGILGSVMGILTVSGPLIGGILSESFGWPSIFYVNIPIGILAGILVYFTTKETPKYGEGQKIDFWGMILSSTAIFSAVYGLIQKENHAQLSWLNPQIAFWLIAAVVLLLVFIVVESRIEKPMMDLFLFKNKNFVGSIIVAFALGSGVYAMQIFITSMMENALSYAAFETGLRQVPMTIWSLILGPVAGYLTNKFSNRRTIAINLLVGAVGLLLFANAMTTQLSYQELILPLILLGVSNGLVNPLLNNAALADAKPDEIGMVSGLVNVFMQLGTSFGVVILGLSQSRTYDNHLHTFFNSFDVHLPSIEKIHNQLLAEGPFSSHSIMSQDIKAPMAIVKSVQHAASKAFYAGMNSVMLVSASILTVAAVLAFFLLKDGQAAKNLENN